MNKVDYQGPGGWAGTACIQFSFGLAANGAGEVRWV